jgi:hypothetical protein
MSRKPLDPTDGMVDVKWDDPRIQALMAQTEGLRLENRGLRRPQRVLIHRGWSENPRPDRAMMTAEYEDGRVVLLTNVAFERNSPVMVEIEAVGDVPAVDLFGEVVDSRTGTRAEDQQHRVWVVTVQVVKRAGAHLSGVHP